MAVFISGRGAVQYRCLIPPSERVSEVAAGTRTLEPFLVTLPVGP